MQQNLSKTIEVVEKNNSQTVQPIETIEEKLAKLKPGEPTIIEEFTYGAYSPACKYYLFPDGIKVSVDKVEHAVKYSKMQGAEREAFEALVGKSLTRIQQEHFWKEAMRYRLEEEEKARLRREEDERRERAAIQRGKDLISIGKLIVLRDGVQVKELPPFEDDDFRKISREQLSCDRTHTDDIQSALVLHFISKKYPGYTAIVIGYEMSDKI